jgi:hypothetical protein
LSTSRLAPQPYTTEHVDHSSTADTARNSGWLATHHFKSVWFARGRQRPAVCKSHASCTAHQRLVRPYDYEWGWQQTALIPVCDMMNWWNHSSVLRQTADSQRRGSSTILCSNDESKQLIRATCTTLIEETNRP